MDLLFLSHCVPNPPDKGEKIRAFHILRFLSSRYNVHLACLARSSTEAAHINQLRGECASVWSATVPEHLFSPRLAADFLLGESLTVARYSSIRMKRYIRSSYDMGRFDAAFVFSTAMAAYAPPGCPLLLDMVDVDSEKWFEYANVRRPSRLYKIEAHRLRQRELFHASRAVCTLLTTRQEQEIFQSFAPGLPSRCMTNGVDCDYFDPGATTAAPALEKRSILIFVGAMDYFPNADAAVSFATKAFPALRAKHPSLEFFVLGRNPLPSVKNLARIDGVTVTGTVDDVRPFVRHALAVVVPLRIARGVQNKVLESLAMGKQVFASTAVRRTFGDEIPPGLVVFDTMADLVARLDAALPALRPFDPAIRAAACKHFCWDTNLLVLGEEMKILEKSALPGNRKP